MNRIEAARYIAECHDRTNVSVDDNAEVNAVPNGIWVQAWVFVPNAEIDDMVKESKS
jgi:hypothetical protein